MRVVHPLWRGFYLAAMLAAARVLLGPVDALSPYLLSRRGLALALGLTAGAFLASVPGRFRKKGERLPLTWQRCLLSFLCGAAMVLAYRLADGGRVLSALMEGSAGAYAFAGAAVAAGFITARIAGRRRSA